MNWWAWIIGGALLFGAELTVINAQFYLVFIGTAALIVGLIDGSVTLALWAQWALFAGLLLVSMPVFRRRIYRRLHGHAPGVRSGPLGSNFTLPVSLAPGESCTTEHAGSLWTVRSDADAPMAAGARVRVVRIQGLTLLVRPAD
jgi:membrane protein implicated in regulation of membrane protease activity